MRSTVGIPVVHGGEDVKTLPIRYALIFSAALLSGCGTPLRDSWVPSPNFNERRPNYVIIHQTDSVSHERALNTLTNPARSVSVHYLVAKDGHITQLVDEKDRAWHAGESFWGGTTDMNSASVGIELDHKGDLPFEEKQIEALLTLLGDIASRHRIPASNYLGHGDIAPRRKVDPNRHFPWKRLADQGFGIWCDTEESSSFVAVDSLLGLQALGYDIGDPDKAALAFKRHYRGMDDSAVITEDDRRLIACLLMKKTPIVNNRPNKGNGNAHEILSVEQLLRKAPPN